MWSLCGEDQFRFKIKFIAKQEDQLSCNRQFIIDPFLHAIFGLVAGNFWGRVRKP